MIRHAQPERREVAEGPADPPLSPLGVEQAERLAAYLAAEHLDAIYSSPLQRARQTAAPLASERSTSIAIDDDLAELDRDSSWYIPIEELRASDDPRWKALASGEMSLSATETQDQFRQRVRAGLDRIIAANPSRRVAVVCHGGVINAVIAAQLGIDLGPMYGFFYPYYTSIHRITAARDGRRSLVTLNETSHLRDMPGTPQSIR